MIELGELEKKHEEFTKRNTRILVASIEPPDMAAKTQADFPHLTVLADNGRGLSEKLKLIHAKAAPDGSDVLMPTTIVLDKSGTVRWLHRTKLVVARPSPEEVLAAIDANIPKAQ